MDLLVTGSAGFMGSCFVRLMLKNHHDWKITSMDKLTYAGNMDNLAAVRADRRHTFVKADIADEAEALKLSKGKDAIINYAACTHVDRSIASPKEFVTTNVFGVYSLLEAARKNDISRFVQISTDEVYGSTSDGLFSEKSPFDPSSPYSASKAAGDVLVKAYCRTYGLDAIVTNSCNCYGPYQHPEKFIPLAITNLASGKKIPVYGRGANVREWLFVEEHAAATEFINSNGKNGETYNIGSGERVSNIELANRLSNLLGKSDSIEFVADRPGHDFRYALDSSKLAKLGWKAKITLAEGLKKAVSWYSANELWWKKLVAK